MSVFSGITNCSRSRRAAVPVGQGEANLKVDDRDICCRPAAAGCSGEN